MKNQSTPDDDSLLVLLAKLFFNLACLAAPFALLFYLPAPLIIAYWVTAHLAEWIENRITGSVNHTWIWMLASCLGMSILLAGAIADSLMGTVAGIVCFVLLLVVHEGWRKLAKLHIEHSPSGPRMTEVKPLAHQDADPWSRAPLITPEGETVRELSWGEIAMGGPSTHDYMLPDGSIIFGAGTSCGFSPNGRWFVSLAPSRSDWPLMVYDRRKHILYVCDIQSRLDNIDLVGDLTITGRGGNKTWTVMIDELITHADRHQMVKVADLRIAQNHWQYLRDRYEKTFPEPAEQQQALISWRLFVPASLQALKDPLDALYYPKGELFEGDTSSGLLTSMAFPCVIWRHDARALVCEAVLKEANNPDLAYWLWTHGHGWRSLVVRQPLDASIPYASEQKLADLDARYLSIEWHLSQPSLSEDTHGTLSSYTAGRLYMEEDEQVLEQPVVRQRVPLHADGNEPECIQSAPFSNGHRLTWRFDRHDAELDRLVYDCEFQDQTLEGQWLLDHRLCNSGRYIALVAYAAAPAAPHRIGILDSQTAALSWVNGDFLDPQLQGFVDGRLHFVHVTDRRPDTLPAGLDPEFYTSLAKPAETGDEPQKTTPPADHARTFLQQREDSRLHYTRTTVALGSAG